MRHAHVASLSLLAALGLTALAPTLAHAELFSLGADTYDVEFVAGTGSNKALLEIDFNNSGTFLFGYQWNGTRTGRDQLLDLTAASAGLSFTDTQFTIPNPPNADIVGYYVNTIHYNALTPPDSYPSSFWYWFTSNDGQTWSESWIGYSDTLLADGGFYGWALQTSDPNFPDYLGLPASNYPDAVEPVTGSAIPEPATISLLGLSIVALITKRRAQQR